MQDGNPPVASVTVLRFSFLCGLAAFVVISPFTLRRGRSYPLLFPRRCEKIVGVRLSTLAKDPGTDGPW